MLIERRTYNPDSYPRDINGIPHGAVVRFTHDRDETHTFGQIAAGVLRCDGRRALRCMVGFGHEIAFVACLEEDRLIVLDQGATDTDETILRACGLYVEPSLKDRLEAFGIEKAADLEALGYKDLISIFEHFKVEVPEHPTKQGPAEKVLRAALAAAGGLA